MDTTEAPTMEPAGRRLARAGRARWFLATLLLVTAALAGCVGDDGGASPNDQLGPTGTTDNGTAANDTQGEPNGSDPAEEPEGNATAPGDELPEEPVTVEVTVEHTGTFPIDPGYTLSIQSVPAEATVVLTYRNTDGNPLGRHDWYLDGVEGAKTDVLDQGEEQTITFTAPMEPGDYVYYCTVDGHRERGLEGTLTVTAA